MYRIALFPLIPILFILLNCAAGVFFYIYSFKMGALRRTMKMSHLHSGPTGFLAAKLPQIS